MKYTAIIKGNEVELNYEPTYDPQDFVRNNDIQDLFLVENWDWKINMELVVRLMQECYKQLLETNYL